MEYLAAFDLGTTGAKACLMAETGAIVATATVNYPSHYPEPGHAEQDPADWWDAVCRSSRHLLERSGVDPARVAAIGFSGHMMGCLGIDAAGEPVGRAWLHSDTRAAPECEALEAAVGFDRYYTITGQRLDPHYPLFKWMALRRLDPAGYDRVDCFVQSKDWIAGRFAGVRRRTDFSDASLSGAMDLTTGEWSEALLEAAGVARLKMPEAVPSATVIGRLTREAAVATGLREGTPVTMGGGDGGCAAVGSAAVEPGDAYVNVGSTAWISLVTGPPQFDPEGRYFLLMDLDGRKRHALGTVQGAGNVYRWIQSVLDGGGCGAGSGGEGGDAPDFEALNALAARSPAGAGDLLFLPYLEGERTPLWDPRARGAWIGLGIGHGRGDLIRAALEGVAFALRSVRDCLDPAGSRIARLAAVGGMVRGALFQSILASVLGAPLGFPACAGESTAIGAAVAAGVGVGMFPGYGEARRIVAIASEAHPVPAWEPVYDQAYARFTAAYPALRAIFHAAPGAYR